VRTIIVVTRPEDWPEAISGTDVLTAEAYLGPEGSALPNRVRVVNLCRRYAYQALGYYVSLLAEARGHRPMPSVRAMQDLRSRAVFRVTTQDLQLLLTTELRGVEGNRSEIDVFFGLDPKGRCKRVAAALFGVFAVPLFRAEFRRTNGSWVIHRVSALSWSDLGDDARGEAVEAARRFLARPVRSPRRRRPSRFDLAILVDPDDPTAPSDEAAIRRFVSAAAEADVAAEVLSRESVPSRLLEFDAAFIRATTSVEHWTYRAARRAQAEGMVVIDDPLSILRCTNKVFLTELLARHAVAMPNTVAINRYSLPHDSPFDYPCVVKLPDSSSSMGVFRADDGQQFRSLCARLLPDSDLLVCQEFLPTEFDWRIGILDGRPLFASKYYMAPGHWQIIRNEAASETQRYGAWEAVDLADVPPIGLRTATRAAGLVGDGLYGVDLKQVGDRWLVIEVNDNPSIETGVEDGVLGADLYRAIIRSFVNRLDEMTSPQRTPRNRIAR
jgi:glutathione synthase/RimK-type ligase-like ATP-grasp enzyme